MGLGFGIGAGEGLGTIRGLGVRAEVSGAVPVPTGVALSAARIDRPLGRL
ncbi:hypothetical protein MUY27_14440 [Mucilaginibacter sp. RS28]|uniref:Uncharacterized protein n=1 Tax=Mucilaginibacter straminoryzae TaxID=2932774 RepID=A0A9X1X742_9SPHI|nr:hypothetical protein [Mucilaginibacter straminoryzae]MCJ8210913.1 hypothetical protein [Mucilaginibacter straminoryzae]